MSDAEEFRRRSEAYLRQATMTDDLAERARLLALAVHWNHAALEAETRARASQRPRPR